MLLAVLSSTAPAATAAAEDYDFEAILVYRITSEQQIGDQLFLEAEGAGVSALLGPITATAAVTQTIEPGCDRATGEVTYSVDGGTLRLQIEHMVCGTNIDGSWSVVVGTGLFADASGGGSDDGVIRDAATVPIIIHEVGTLSF